MAVADKLWLPGEHRLAFQCNVCGKQFYQDEKAKLDRHVIKCAERNEEAVLNLSARHRLREVFDAGDAELEEWVRKNQEAVKEGRKKM